MYFLFTLFLALCAVSISAYQVSSPTEGDSWSGSGNQTVKWSRVSTDKPSFAIFLANVNHSEQPVNNLLLQSDVDGSLKNISVSLPKDRSFCGRTFRVNLCMNDKSPESILAQSAEFDIAIGDCRDGRNISSDHPTATPYFAQGQAKMSTASSSSSSLRATTPVSNKARDTSPINPYVAGLCASLAVLGAFMV